MNEPDIPYANPGAHARVQIEVADASLTFRQISLDEDTPTGAQLALAAGYKDSSSVAVLQMLENGEMEDIRPQESAALLADRRRFIIVETDREYLITIDGQRLQWPCRIISGATVRKLGNISENKGVYLEQAEVVDRLIESQDFIDLDAPGVERFVARQQVWELNVQGVPVRVNAPTILVRDALTKAGFDPNQGWHIFLKVAGSKKELAPDDVIDLRAPGIEKIRLTPREVNNGEAQLPRRHFELLDGDESCLNALGMRWETVVDAGRRWLMIHAYPVPAGFTVEKTVLALEIPPTYPGAQIDMFYTNPPLLLSSGQQIAQTQVNETICGASFNRWSRHRGPGSMWSPTKDNVITHLALVESAISKEVGE